MHSEARFSKRACRHRRAYSWFVGNRKVSFQNSPSSTNNRRQSVDGACDFYQKLRSKESQESPIIDGGSVVSRGLIGMVFADQRCARPSSLSDQAQRAGKTPALEARIAPSKEPSFSLSFQFRGIRFSHGLAQNANLSAIRIRWGGVVFTTRSNCALEMWKCRH